MGNFVGKGGGSKTLQEAYTASPTDGQVITNTTGGAFKVKRGSTSDTDDVFCVLDGAGVQNFTVTGNGDFTTKGTALFTSNAQQLVTIKGDGSQLTLEQFELFDATFMQFTTPFDVRRGWIGFGSTGSELLRITNQTPTGNLELATANTARMTILNNGKIGIGKAVPVVELDVVGDIAASGSITATDFVGGGLSHLLYISTVDDKITNTGTEGSLMGSGLGSVTIAKERLRVGATYNIRVRGTITNVSTPTVAITIKLGTVTIGATGSQQLTNITGTATFDIDFTFTVRNEGTSGSAMGVGEFKTSTGDSLRMALLPDVTINTTIDQDIATLFKWTSVNATNTITSQVVTITEQSL